MGEGKGITRLFQSADAAGSQQSEIFAGRPGCDAAAGLIAQTALLLQRSTGMADPYPVPMPNGRPTGCRPSLLPGKR
jgi:hypothetical protein